MTTFDDIAASCGVPSSVVADAALHTFMMLDVDEQVALIEEAMVRKVACDETSASTNTVVSGDTKIVLASKRYQMRDDLIYRLQHEHFDMVYAYAVDLQKEDGPIAEWVFVVPRPGEDEAPPSRVSLLLGKLLVGLRKAKQRFEGVREAALRGGFR